MDAASMGAAFTAVRRYRLTPDGARCFMESEAYFHRTRRINQIACFLPAVEWFYRLAVKLPEMAYTGHFRSFHWCLRDGVDTMAHYDSGTVAFLWSGPRQTGSRLSARFEESGRSCDSTGGWPSIVCVVAADSWQACRVSETLPDFGLDDSSFVYCTDTEMLSGNLAPRARMSLHSIHPLLSSPVNTVPAELPQMMRDVRSGADAHLVYRILYLVEQFPGAGVASMNRSLGSHPRYVSKKVKRLLDEDMLVQIDGHHYLSSDALATSAQRDRVHISRPGRRFGPRDHGVPAVARYRRHDEAAFSIVSI